MKIKAKKYNKHHFNVADFPKIYGSFKHYIDAKQRKQLVFQKKLNVKQ